VPDRQALTGILFVLKTGIPWEELPRELNFGSGMTCWRRLRDWHRLGAWEAIHHACLERLQAAGGAGQRLGAGRFGGEETGANPTDRAKAGTKHHIITAAQGIPLAVKLTGANRHDITQALALVDAIPALKGQRGRPRRRPLQVLGDRGYDSEPLRRELRRRNILPWLGQRGQGHGSGLGVYRWVIERTLSWLHQFRRLRVRYERRADIHQAFLTLGCIIIGSRFLFR
jgi:transposase